MPNHLSLDGLDENQYAAACAPPGPVCVIAGPGSGKTRTVVARIAQLTEHISPDTMLALTHTTKAAGELRDRVSGTGTDVTATTIHAAAWRHVRENWNLTGRTGEPRLAASTWGMMKDASVKVLGRTKATNDNVSELVSELDWARASLLEVGGYAQGSQRNARQTNVDATSIDKIWDAYNDIKTLSGVIDFADVIHTATDMLTHVPVTPWQALFVDEYQDVDLAQQALIDAWLNGGDTITAVGDSEQAIFGFKGGDPTLLATFEQRYKGALVVHLSSNYRSTTPIVDWVNSLTVAKRPSLHSVRGDGPAPRIVIAHDETAEERQLVSQLQTWQQSGIAWKEMAVLYRYNATSARIESALAHAGVPYHVAGNQKFFDRPEIRAVLVPFGQWARSEPMLNGLELLEACALETGWTTTAPNGMGPARQRWEAVASLIDMVRERYSLHAAASVLAMLQQRAKEAHDLTPGGVTLATTHGAKGLEWEAVWVAGVSEGQMPSSYATTKAQLEEEQHLMYVAVSRARTEVVVSHAGRRHNGWRAEPSRFLKLLTAAGASGETSHPGRRPAGRETGGKASTIRNSALSVGMPRSECTKCGDRLIGAAARTVKLCSAGCLEGDPAARWQILNSWRNDKADELQVDLTKVATDKALFTTAVTGTSASVPGFSQTGSRPPM